MWDILVTQCLSDFPCSFSWVSDSHLLQTSKRRQVGGKNHLPVNPHSHPFLTFYCELVLPSMKDEASEISSLVHDGRRAPESWFRKGTRFEQMKSMSARAHFGDPG